MGIEIASGGSGVARSVTRCSRVKILVTGSSGHLGEALVRTLEAGPHEVEGLDLLDSRFTRHVGSITDPGFVARCVRGVDAVIHTAALHKPHVATHPRRDFVETNIAGTLHLLEASLRAGITAFVFTSTTSVFGAAMRPREGEPATWVHEGVRPIPRNIYGVTKVAAEDLCELFARTRGLPTIVLRTSRFFPEPDDDPRRRERFDDANLKANEFLYRRLDLADAVEAHLLALERAPALKFGRYLLSATTPFRPEHLSRLGAGAAEVVGSLFPDYAEEYARRGWAMLPTIDRVYVNRRAREELGWRPRFDYRYVLERLRRDESIYSGLALEVGSKGYHREVFEEGPYPVEGERD